MSKAPSCAIFFLKYSTENAQQTLPSKTFCWYLNSPFLQVVYSSIGNKQRPLYLGSSFRKEVGEMLCREELQPEESVFGQSNEVTFWCKTFAWSAIFISIFWTWDGILKDLGNNGKGRKEKGQSMIIFNDIKK